MADHQDTSAQKGESSESVRSVSMRTFLESVAPGTIVEIEDLYWQSGGTHRYTTPDIILHCTSDICGGDRTFSSSSREIFSADGRNFYLEYICQNCKETKRTFAIKSSASQAVKFGEYPPFGPPTPKRALSLMGADRALFFKGRKCELQGLGLGAFTYYRRVIENQRNKIFDEMIRVIQAIDPSNEVLEELRAAKEERQFSNSIEAIKHALPSSLLINGQNPLRLLHSALSEGMHNLSDDECLAIATAIRTVLIEFSERLAQALRDDAELSHAISVLTKIKK